MPILDKMQQNNEPDDSGEGEGESNGSSWDNVPTERKKRFHERPKFVPSRQGHRQISIAALVERIADQFREENTPDDTAVRAAKTRADRAKLLRPVIDYVLTVESVTPDESAKAEIARQAYSEIFGFGPLDQYIEDPDVTTISIDGRDDLSVRYQHGELEPVKPIFDDQDHLQETTQRLLKAADATLREDIPIVEAGFTAESGRLVSLSVAGPPVSFSLNLDIRLHPAQPPTLDSLIERGTLTQRTADLLTAIVRSQHGFAVVGQPESGKTMTLSALLTQLPDPASAVAVERTGELHLPEDMHRATVQWAPGVGLEGVTFGEQIERQIEENNYQTIVLDEVRADEPKSIGPLLTAENPPRLIWSFRGPPDSKRLYSALGMLARRATNSQDEGLVSELFRRLPFVISVRRLRGRIELREVGEWIYPDGAVSAQYHALTTTEDGEITLTGEKPVRPLALDNGFWGAGAS